MALPLGHVIMIWVFGNLFTSTPCSLIAICNFLCSPVSREDCKLLSPDKGFPSLPSPCDGGILNGVQKQSWDLQIWAWFLQSSAGVPFHAWEAACFPAGCQVPCRLLNVLQVISNYTGCWQSERTGCRRSTGSSFSLST